MLLMEYLTLGTVIDAFGLDGTLKVISSTYFAEKRYKKDAKILLFNKKNECEILTIVSFRTNKGLDFIKTKEITTKEEALERKGCLIKVEKDSSVLSKGEYYFSDLEKCKVYDENNTLLGWVKKVEEFPSTITLRVGREKGRDFFVPYLELFIKDIDIENQKITIKVMEGML